MLAEPTLPPPRFSAIGEWLLRLSWPKFSFLCLTVTLFRGGIWLANSKRDWVGEAALFPHHPDGWWYEDWLFFLLPKTVGTTTLDSFIALYGLLTILFFAIAFLVPYLLLSRDLSRFFIVSLLACAIPVTLTYQIGWYDVLTLLGTLIIAVSARPWLVALGAVVLSGSNPSLALVSAVAFVILTGSPQFRTLRSNAFLTLSITAAGWLAANIWLHSIGISGQDSLLLHNLHFSVISFLYAAPIAICAWFGAAWPLVFALIATTNVRHGRYFMIAALILIPGLASITTLDGTRVFVDVAALPFLAALWAFCTAKSAATRARSAETSQPWSADIVTWTGVLAVTTLVVPAIYYWGDSRTIWLPWQWLFGGAHFT